MLGGSVDLVTPEVRMVELERCRVDLVSGAVYGLDDELTLSSRERLLLAYLADRPSVDVSRDELLTRVWGYSDQVMSRAVDTAVHRLRDKLELDPERPRHLLTAFGVGYRFEPRRPEIVQVHALPPGRRLVLGDRSVDLDLGTVLGPAGPVSLTTTEAALLRALAERAGQRVDRRTLLRQVWPDRLGGARLLDGAIHRLRTKLEPDPAHPRYLETVRGVGYRLTLAPELSPQGSLLALVHVRIWRERQLWQEEPGLVAQRVVGLLQRLNQTSRAAQGLPVGEGWRHAFPKLSDALRWAQTLQQQPEEDGLVLQVAIGRGRPLLCVDPVTGSASCVGGLVHQIEDLLDWARPGLVTLEDSLWDEALRLGFDDELFTVLSAEGPARLVG
jgi:DNA-binding response OmpR family regulator